MANLVKAVLTFDDGSTQEFDVAAPATPTQTVTLTNGETLEVIAQ